MLRLGRGICRRTLPSCRFWSARLSTEPLRWFCEGGGVGRGGRRGGENGNVRGEGEGEVVGSGDMR